MTHSVYIPNVKDIVWLEFDPQIGKETKKIRPALIISPKEYNRKVGLSLCLTITSKIKNYPFEVILNNSKISGAILCDQIRSLDWQARNAIFITNCSENTFKNVLQKIKILIFNEL